PERAAARLLVVDRGGAPLRHAHVGDLPGFLRAGDVLVVNDTRVIPARVPGRRPSGGRLELRVVGPLGEDGGWEVLVRGTPRPGERVHLAGGRGEWVAPLGDGRWRLRLALDEPALAWLERVGEVPLPPYVRRAPTPADRERYQTVYARVPGAVAAPTAGLHLSAELLAAIAAAGVRVASLTLHVGPGTFLPIRTDDLAHHVMAPEPSDIPPATVEAIGGARAGRTGGRRRHDDRARAGVGLGGRHGACRSRRGGALHAARPPLPGGGRAAHELPPAALDPARAGGGVRRLGPHPRGLRRGGAARLPLLQLRRRHAHHVSAPFAFEVVRVDP